MIDSRVTRLACEKCGETYELVSVADEEITDAEVAFVVGEFACPSPWCTGDLVLASDAHTPERSKRRPRRGRGSRT